jgi:hypothetical protein
MNAISIAWILRKSFDLTSALSGLKDCPLEYEYKANEVNRIKILFMILFACLLL